MVRFSVNLVVCMMLDALMKIIFLHVEPSGVGHHNLILFIVICVIGVSIGIGDLIFLVLCFIYALNTC